MELTIDVLDRIAHAWYLKVNGNDIIDGFANRFAALAYYRNNVLCTKPNSVLLYAKTQLGEQFAYTII